MRCVPRLSLPLLAFATSFPSVVRADDLGANHTDPVASVALGLAVILVAAKLGSELATRLGQAAVLGELIAGVVLGNLGRLGVSWFERLGTDLGIDLIARIGVLVLLFEVGLESTVAQMMKLGSSAVLVACLGVAAPFGLGWAVATQFLPSASPYTHLFIGATLTATSVGITARVLKDLGRSSTADSRMILGAAVVDDVLGLVILAIVTGLIASANLGTPMSAGHLVWILGRPLGFLVGVLGLGILVSRRIYAVASRLQARGVLLALSLALCFALSWAADAMGLAAIVGAFAAGLILEDVHYRDFVQRGERSLEELLRPISSFLVPVFFVVMGLRTDLRVFADVGVLGLAAALSVVAVLGKQVCALGARGPGVDRVLVGLGMVPRGEVGLIFANVGLALRIHGRPLIDPSIFAAIVAMVIVTTMIAPPLLKWRLSRQHGSESVT